MSRAKKKGTIMDGSFENEVPPPAVDGTDSAIPSSGLDVLFNKKGEDDPEELPTEEELTEWKKLVFPSSRKLPTYDGFLDSDLFGRKIPFHFVQIMPGPCDAEFAYSMSMFSARLLCNIVDIFRGRQKLSLVEKVLSEDYMRKLKIASAQIVSRMKRDAKVYAQFGLLPITVYTVESWMISPTCFESTVLMGIGSRRLCGNMKCVLKGSAWKFVTADFGM